MKNNETFFKGKIKRIDYCFDTYSVEDIIFRVVNVDGIYFFAEEITTGSIFPIYEFIGKRNSKGILFKTTSYLENGRYFVYYPLIADKTIFKCKLDERPGSLDGLKIASYDEINRYLRRKLNNKEWKQKLSNLEKTNTFMCDLKLLKEKISLVKKEEFKINFDSNKIEYDDNAKKINIDKISNYGYDLSTQKELCNLIGRESEINKIIRTLTISGESVLLVGPTGSGKTAIVERIAYYTNDNTNKWLRGKTIFYVDTASLTAGTNYRGQFEEKIQKLLKFSSENKGQLILFIDEIHILYGLGRTHDSSIDAMNILKPYLSKGEITIIGATTNDEYKKYIAEDSAFENRLEKINISLPDKDLNIEILMAYIKELQIKYNIKLNINEDYMISVVEYLIDITDPVNQKNIGDIKIPNPKISKRILKDAFTEAIYQGKDFVTIDDLCFAIIDCDKLSPTIRKEKARKLKEKLNFMKQLESNKTILKLQRK